MTRLETGLPEQRKAFEKLISDTKNSLEQAIRQRDEAAAKREAASRAEYEKNVKAKNDEILSLSKKLAELELMLEKERFALKQLEELKKKETPETEVKPPAAAAAPEKTESATPVNPTPPEHASPQTDKAPANE